MSRILIILFLLFVLYSCEEYFMPDIEPQKSILVIEGLITDVPGVHEVKISRSMSFEESTVFEKSRGYEVYVEDDLGEVFPFTEIGNGVYNSERNLKGEIGRSYRVVATSPKNIRYHSEFELLQAAAPIDSIYGKVQYESVLRYFEATGYVEQTERGLQIQNDFVRTEGSSEFYRYEYDLVMQTVQTYPYSPFPVVEFIVRPINSRKLEFLSDVNSNAYANHQVVGNPVEFVSEFVLNTFITIEEHADMDPEAVSFQDAGFLILLKQYSLSEKGYNFWNAIKVQSQASGQIFDPVQSQIYGNIMAENDTAELVFGYFGASAVTEKGMHLRLLYNDSVAVNSIKYFPKINRLQHSNIEYDFWIK